jgi:hypothetical protein
MVALLHPPVRHLVVECAWNFEKCQKNRCFSRKTTTGSPEILRFLTLPRLCLTITHILGDVEEPLEIRVGFDPGGVRAISPGSRFVSKEGTWVTLWKRHG